MAGKKVIEEPVQSVRKPRKRAKMHLAKDGQIAESEVDELMSEGEADVAEKK